MPTLDFFPIVSISSLALCFCFSFNGLILCHKLAQIPSGCHYMTDRWMGGWMS